MLPAEVNKHRFTVEEYQKMGEAGVFGEDDRVELIDGEIVEMTPIGWRHVEAVDRLNHLLWSFAAGRHRVSVQNPVVLGEHGEQQPDLMLIREPGRTGRLPEAADVLLVVEVSDSSLAYDRNVKLPRYAAAGIPEAWILDLTGTPGGEALELYAHPSEAAPASPGSGFASSAGSYRSEHRFRPGELIVSEIVEGLSFPVEDVLP